MKVSPGLIVSFVAVARHPFNSVKSSTFAVNSTSVPSSFITIVMDLKGCELVFFILIFILHPAHLMEPMNSMSKDGTGVGVMVGEGVGGGKRTGSAKSELLEVEYSPQTQQNSTPGSGLRM